MGIIDFFSIKFDVLWVKMFKNSEKVLNLRELTHFEHQITISEHRFDFLDVYLHQKKILMVKVYG